jgi:hypothetical protein
MTATVDPQSRSQRRTPPPETFWKRYSRHGEFPLSTVVSASLHVLLGGLLILGALFLWTPAAPKKIPVDVVRGPGSTGLNPGAKQPGEVGNHGAAGDEAPEPRKDAKPTRDDPPPPGLDPEAILAELPREQRTPDREARIREGVNLSHFKNINDRRDQRLREGLREPPGPGQDGAGRDGVKDKGRDKGEGDRPGSGKTGGLRNEREEFLERCDLKFVTRGPGDYFRQLKALGAVLAVPIPEEPFYRIVYTPPGTKEVKDIRELNRVYWKDYRPDSVQEMMTILKRPERPSHFVALMPQELEDRLRAMEKQQAEAHGRAVKDVRRTVFRVVEKDGRYVVELAEQTYF